MKKILNSDDGGWEQYSFEDSAEKRKYSANFLFYQIYTKIYPRPQGCYVFFGFSGSLGLREFPLLAIS